MTMTLDEFLNITKVLKMLYGRTVAEVFFVKNFELFTGHTVNDLQELVHSAKVNSSQE